MFRSVKGLAISGRRHTATSLCRLAAAASLCALLSAPSLWAESSDGGPALGVARISLARGEVAVQRGESGDTIQARANLPLVEGDYLTTGPASRAEVQLDYSNLLRLDRQSSIRLGSLGNRSFLVQVERGTITYSELRGGDADVDIETPLAAVRPQKHGRYRIEVVRVDEVVVIVRKGTAEVASADGRQPLKKGQRLVIRGGGREVAFHRTRAYPEDAWDEWNRERDRQLTRSNVYSHVNRSIYGAEDLDGYGRWVHVPRYGRCWFPSVTVGWAPYRHGRWVWLDFYGWSWVSYDPWGWAPYHYGRWFRHARHGWGWHPGSYTSHYRWRPALVAFFGYNGPRVGPGAGFGHYGWVPLAPGEPYHPWWGSPHGSGRAAGGNIVLVDNSVNIYNNYRNARHRSGITLVDAVDFSRGKMVRAGSLKVSELRKAKVMRGRVPVVPDRSSQGQLIRKTGRSIRAGSNPGRFFSSGRSRRSIIRSSFSRQQQEMTRFVRSAGITASRPAGRANARSGAKGDARAPAATSSSRRRPNTRLGGGTTIRRSSPSPAGSTVRPARSPVGGNPKGRSAGKRITIRSSGKGGGASEQRGPRFDRRQSGRKNLSNKRPSSRVSAPAPTRSRPGSSRKVRRSRPSSPSSPPRVNTKRNRSPSPRSSVTAPRSSKRSSGIRTSSPRKPRTPAKRSVTSGSRRSAPRGRSSSPRVSAGSSGRSSPKKSTTRSRRSPQSDDRSTKKRRIRKR